MRSMTMLDGHPSWVWGAFALLSLCIAGAVHAQTPDAFNPGVFGLPQSLAIQADGKVCFYTNGHAAIVADIAGYVS